MDKLSKMHKHIFDVSINIDGSKKRSINSGYMGANNKLDN